MAQPYVEAYVAGTGSIVHPAPNTGPPATHGSVTLVAGTTYYFPIGVEIAPLDSVHFVWDANIVITSARIEDGNLSSERSNDWDTTLGAWVPEDPDSAYVAHTSGAVTNATLAVAGGVAGGAVWHVGNNGTTRQRFAVVVGVTGGVVTVAMARKTRA